MTEESSQQELHYVENQYLEGLTPDDVISELIRYPMVYEIYKKNKEDKQWDFVRKMLRVPSSKDKPGFVYGFVEDQE